MLWKNRKISIPALIKSIAESTALLVWSELALRLNHPLGFYFTYLPNIKIAQESETKDFTCLSESSVTRCKKGAQFFQKVPKMTTLENDIFINSPNGHSSFVNKNLSPRHFKNIPI